VKTGSGLQGDDFREEGTSTSPNQRKGWESSYSDQQLLGTIDAVIKILCEIHVKWENGSVRDFERGDVVRTNSIFSQGRCIRLSADPNVLKVGIRREPLYVLEATTDHDKRSFGQKVSY
jgi:hypothetical protein